MLEHWIWLVTRQGLNKRKQYELLQQFGDPEALYEASGEMLPAACADKSLEEACELLNRCRAQDIRLLTFADTRYPRRLRGIYDPPLVLYYRGSLPDWEAKPIIGAVGTRSCSAYGSRSGRRLGAQLTQCGGCVASGMAEGIDAAILSGVLAAQGSPVVFLAGGVDVIYPAENRELYNDILAQDGCILSEQPPGMKPVKWLFPHRNRLISGISNAVLVVEAPEKSGALITARHALKQGRQVYAVPGLIDADTCRGSNALLKDGATMVQSGWDILEPYQGSYEGIENRLREAEPVLKDGAPPPIYGRKTTRNPSKEKKVIDNGSKQPYIDGETKSAVRSPKEQTIVNQLLSGPRLTDAVINDCGLPRGEALAVMTVLEIQGVLRRLPGNLLALNETEME